MDYPALERAVLPNMHDLGCVPDGRTIDSSEAEVDEKERAHSSQQDRLNNGLQEFDKRLEQKELLKIFAHSSQQDRLNNELQEFDKRLEQKEKMKEECHHKLTMLESQVFELKKKQEAHSQLLKQKQKIDGSEKQFQEKIQKIMPQKLQEKIDQEYEQFLSWKVSQRKTEEGSMVKERSKELREDRKASSQEPSGSGHVNNLEIQALIENIENELEVTVRVNKLRSEYWRQMQGRAAMNEELANLKEKCEIPNSDCLQTMSSSAINSRIAKLEDMLATSFSTVDFISSELSKAEKCEQIFSVREWNQVHLLAENEAKILMNHLFNLVISFRCQLWDKEVISSEKDLALEEKKLLIAKLNEELFRAKNMIKQLEAQQAPSNEINIKVLQKSHHERESSEAESDMDSSDSENVLDMENDEFDENTIAEDCCSCTKNSFCKTKKCACRLVGKSCTSSCCCKIWKCTNRYSIVLYFQSSLQCNAIVSEIIFNGEGVPTYGYLPS